MKFLLVEDELRTWWIEYRTSGMATQDNETIVGIRSKYNGVINHTDVAPELVALGAWDKVGTRFNVTALLTLATSKLWRVTRLSEAVAPVVLREATGNDLLTFSIPDGVVGDVTINPTNHTVQINVEADQAVTALIATFTATPGSVVKIGATVQVSGVTANNFTSPKTYEVTSESGDAQNWTVTVTKLSKIATITGFVLAEQTGAATIDNGASTISIEVGNGTSVTTLVPTITCATGATVDPESLVEQDFTNPVVYTVTSQDLTVTQDWVVTVTEAA